MPESLDRARTPLLTLITQESLDRDYQLVAARGTRTTGPRYRAAVVAVVGAFAMLVTVAAVQTSANAEVDSASRAGLIDRIESRRATVARLQEELARLRAANASAEQDLRTLGRRYADERARRTELGTLTGFEPATGSGVRVTVDNPSYAGVSQRVQAADLALLVDGLWAAGAEAISINGQRLNPRGGITDVSEAIEINGTGVAPPYTVLAIGDRGTLAADFVETPSGLRFVALARQYGFDQKMVNADDLHLPAAPGALMRLPSAKVMDRAGRSGGGPDDRKGETP